jgi:hypothetical protein
MTWDVFLNTVESLRKRQQSSSVSKISLQELVSMCPLNNVRNSNVAAGCISGIYQRFCMNPTNETLLGECHDAYNRTFSASIFKSLGDVCPSWRQGPQSRLCVEAISSFAQVVSIGGGYQLTLTSAHAQEPVQSIFASRVYAPCLTSKSVTCNWSKTD